jgi:hypothetical protein
MQINPGLSFTQPSASHIQIGSGYRARELTGVSQAVQNFLHRLRDGIVDGEEALVARECQVTEAECHMLLTQLAPLLVSTPEARDFVVSADPDHRGSLARLRCVTPVFKRGRLHGLAPRDRQDFAAQRFSAAIQLFGLGRTGVALTKILMESGVGHLSVWDATRVTTADLGTGLHETDLGQIRSLATATALNPKHQKPRVQPNGWLRRPELGGLATIHITLGGLAPDLITKAKERRHPYLPVVVRDDEIDIGPWVMHHGHACPLCIAAPAESHEIASARPVTSLMSHSGGIETVAGAHLVAGLIATDVLAMIDSQQLRHQVPMTKHGVVPGMTLNTFTRVHLANGWVQTFEVDPRPGCCAALPVLKIANTSAP